MRIVKEWPEGGSDTTQSYADNAGLLMSVFIERVCLAGGEPSVMPLIICWACGEAIPTGTNSCSETFHHEKSFSLYFNLEFKS